MHMLPLWELCSYAQLCSYAVEAFAFYVRLVGVGSNRLSVSQVAGLQIWPGNPAMRETEDYGPSLLVYIRECLAQDCTKFEQKPRKMAKGASQWWLGHLSKDANSVKSG